jgi:dynactin complex subunit
VSYAVREGKEWTDGIGRLEASGKNDGSVNGESYFECAPQHGVFVRPSQVKILEAPKPAVCGCDARRVWKTLTGIV